MWLLPMEHSEKGNKGRGGGKDSSGKSSEVPPLLPTGKLLPTLTTQKSLNMEKQSNHIFLLIGGTNSIIGKIN